MKNIIRFFKYHRIPLSIYGIIGVLFMLSILACIASGLPMLWMKSEVYQKTTAFLVMNISSAPAIYALLSAPFVGSFLLWYRAGYEDRHGKIALRVFALIIGIIAGGYFLTVHVQPALHIEYNGSWNLLWAGIIGAIYTITFSSLFKKPLDYIRSI